MSTNPYALQPYVPHVTQVGVASPPTYPQGIPQSPLLHAIANRKPVGVGGVADAVGGALFWLDVAATIAVIIIGYKAYKDLTHHR